MRLAALLGLAAAPDLAFPLGCALGGSCFVQNAFDHDPGARDALFAPRSHDGHDGTDLALPTLAEQAAGADVLAAAPGVVAGARDGEADVLQGRAAGLRAPGGGWPSGRVEGTATLLRDGEVVAAREAEATLP